MHTVGIDRAVNAGFLQRLARAGGGHCDLVESEDRLDAAMHDIARRIGPPLVRALRLHHDGLSALDDTTAPARLPDLLPGVPLVICGRYCGTATGTTTLRGETGGGSDWSRTLTGQRRDAPALTAQWARAHLRDLEDRYASTPDQADVDELEKRIVATSLRFGVLCRFTACLGVDSRVVAQGAAPRRVIQPVDPPSGWEISPAMLFDETPAGCDYLLGDEFDEGECWPEPTAFPQSHAPQRQRSQILRDYLDDEFHRPSKDFRRELSAAADHTVPDCLELTAARDLVGEEARRLRAAGTITDDQRRELLADLAHRLTELIGKLIAQRVESAAVTELTALVAALQAGGADAAMWDATLHALDDFARGAAESTDRRRTWSR